MKFKTLLVIELLECLFFCSCTKKPESDLSVSQMKCNGFENPVGTGTTPSFSWIPLAQKRGQTETAYEIIVGSDKEITRKFIGDMWD